MLAEDLVDLLGGCICRDVDMDVEMNVRPGRRRLQDGRRHVLYYSIYRSGTPPTGLPSRSPDFLGTARFGSVDVPSGSCLLAIIVKVAAI